MTTWKWGYAVIPNAIDITRVRGDTFPFTFTIKDSAGGVVVITGYTFKLTVDPSDEPPNAENNLFVLNGDIGDGTKGEVEFTPTAEQADQVPATYYFDVEMTDTASAIRTIVKGEWVVVQDITK